MSDTKTFTVTTYPGVTVGQMQNVANSIGEAKLYDTSNTLVYHLEVPQGQIKLAQTRFVQCRPIIEKVE